MGEFPARIAAQDFMTPPEFAHLRLACEGAARIGGARLSLEARAHGTHLTRLYELTPIRVLPFQFGPDEPTLVYLVNSTNGIMDGDAQQIEVHAGRATRTVITGQSATRIHPCSNGFCTQQWKVTVADDAILVVLPGPAIPFASCRYYQRAEVELGRNSRLIWGDIWFAGRYARGIASERFRFDTIVQELLVKRGGQLVYRDRFCWRGPWKETVAAWHFGGHNAVGSLFATGGESLETLEQNAQSKSAILHTASGDSIRRWAGASEMVIRDVGEYALRLAAHFAGNPASANTPWLIAGHRLGPTHWFRPTIAAIMP